MNGTGRHQSLVVVGNLGEGDHEFREDEWRYIHDFDSDGKVALVQIELTLYAPFITFLPIEKKERVLNL